MKTFPTEKGSRKLCEERGSKDNDESMNAPLQTCSCHHLRLLAVSVLRRQYYPLLHVVWSLTNRRIPSALKRREESVWVKINEDSVPYPD
ncbi:hypothetical protein V6N12_038425 [Hibiscus sabdariffa]|uniref:Uncharacterized protein n=1 Tax=Hibiscus sabdariffa TaxID=183260 RepID=A0ABR2BFM6_9ROSI